MRFGLRWAICLVAIGTSALAQQSEKWGMIHLGQTFFEDRAIKDGLHYGLSGGWWLTDRWGLELRAMRGEMKSEAVTQLGFGPGAKSYLNVGSLSLLLNLAPGEGKWTPYLALGGGGTRAFMYRGSKYSLFGLARPELNAGAGVQYRFGQRGMASLDYRLVHSGLRGTTFNDQQATLGLGLRFGAAPKPVVKEAEPFVLPPPPPPPPVESQPEVVTVKAVEPALPSPKVIVEAPVVHFANDESVLAPESSEALAEMAQNLKSVQAPYTILVTGHASAVGPKAYNQKLSQRRAETVANQIRNVLPDALIQAEGRGVSEHVAPNDTRENQAKNRRAEVVITSEAVELKLKQAPLQIKSLRKHASKSARAPKKAAATK